LSKTRPTKKHSLFEAKSAGYLGLFGQNMKKAIFSISQLYNNITGRFSRQMSTQNGIASATSIKRRKISAST
jgi:hypothetical protein